MCCSLDQIRGDFAIESIIREENGSLLIKGIYDCTPKTLADRFSRYFQRLELLEKITEIVDECFHLLGSFLKSHTNAMVYQVFRNLHYAAHDVEHVLHSLCFFGDLTRVLSGKFFLNQEGNPLGYLRTLSRLCHVTAHFFETIKFMNELNLISINSFRIVLPYSPALTALGYAIWMISSIWQRSQKLEVPSEGTLVSELGIYVGGCLFEISHLDGIMDSLASRMPLFSKIASLAGIIHSWFVAQHLMPQDKEVLVGRWVASKNRGKHSHCDHLTHHCHKN